MKVFELRDHFGIDNLVLADRPQPLPGPREILVKVRAVSLNYRDLLVIKGLYNPKLRLPCIPFSDGAGDVVATGAGVSRVKVGDRVAAIFMQTWLSGEMTESKAKSALGGGIDGMLAEYAVLHEDGVVHIPGHLSYEEAATLPCAAVTAWHAVIETGLKLGENVLVLGTGGVSLFALQFARLAGAKVIVTSGSDEKLMRVRELGAEACINYKKVTEWDRQIRELTGGAGVDLVVEVGGSGTLPQSLKAVRAGGRISLIGVLTGTSGDINLLPLIMKKIRVDGILVGSRDMFESMNQALSLHHLHPVVDSIFSFDETRQALRHMESGAHFGKICVKIA
ncbi:MAG TPA: NAD(P)-dependent alcohol dehydrogenase [Dissulfurispiraceae bacterium]|nr:NAD(P)-dependent alcohol dehydrogenase [Dissulfurispiraceae bacterium]